ncbi:MAG TPA: GAF domain-containing protein [Oscillatoriaceae cyanobacterium M7585_C2015_266]|nr:GAF domain-containing protein [Oscillatoriaceae cyanobacterium M7585_C2015_266]
MEESVSDSQSKMLNPLEYISDAFFTLDLEGRFTYLNPAAELLWQRSREELIGKYIWQELPELMHSELEGALRRSANEKVAVDCQVFYTPRESWLSVRTYACAEGLAVYLQKISDRNHVGQRAKQADATEKIALQHLSTLAAKVGIALAQGGPLSEVLERCAQAVVEHLPAAGACIWTYNVATNQIKLEATCGCPTPKENAPAETALISFIASNKEPLSGQLGTINNQIKAKHNHLLSSRKNSTPATEQIIRKGYFAGYPLIVEEQLVGVLGVYSEKSLTEEEGKFLQWLAHSIAIAIDRYRAREALLKRRGNLLFRLANQIRNSLDLNTILETAVHEIRNLLQIDRCHFLWYLPHPENPSLMITHESRAAELPSLISDCPPAHVEFLAAKIEKMEILRIDDVDNDANVEKQARNLLKSLGMTSQLLLPLETRSGQLGAVVCSHCSGPRPWSDSEIELLQAVVNQLAIAIDQAELYAQTHAAALAAQTQAQQLSEALHNLKQTQAQLVQSEKMSSLGQMVAGVAHEINNPVNFIYGNITYAKNYIQEILDLLALYQQYCPTDVPVIQERLKDIDLDFIIEDLPKILSSMEMGAERIRQIVLSLRNFSRLDEAEKKSVDIHEGINNTLLILHNRLKPKGNHPGIEVIKEYGDIPLVECYPGQLNQVFMNILSNAIDALENSSPPRQIFIRTELLEKVEPSSPYRHWVVIRIRDTGPGMTENVKQHLFDPFFTTKPVGKGTGLGLSISYQIVVEKHGGLLKCFSELGQGSEFWIQIPLHSQPRLHK